LRSLNFQPISLRVLGNDTKIVRTMIMVRAWVWARVTVRLGPEFGLRFGGGFLSAEQLQLAPDRASYLYTGISEVVRNSEKTSQ
jgi:hypothetical protein